MVMETDMNRMYITVGLCLILMAVTGAQFFTYRLHVNVVNRELETINLLQFKVDQLTIENRALIKANSIVLDENKRLVEKTAPCVHAASTMSTIAQRLGVSDGGNRE